MGRRKWFLSLLLTWMVAGYGAASVSEWSLSELDERLESIDQELSGLATLSLRGGFGTIGYRSNTHQDSRSVEWVEIDLGATQPIEEVVLVPTIWRDTRSGFRADGFPLAFQIMVGTEEDREGRVVASFGKDDHLLPRVAPVMIPLKDVEAAWVRIEATELTPRAWDQLYLFQLAQVFVFNGNRNVALNRPVTTSSTDSFDSLARSRSFLVNGFVPYLMNGAQGEQSLAFVSRLLQKLKPSFVIDLEEEQSLDSVQLHAIELSDTVPRSVETDFGMPHHLIVEGSRVRDFSDAVTLADYQRESVYEMSPIVVRNFTETNCRYVRVRVLEPYLIDKENELTGKVGFAEIELISNGKNVALGKMVATESEVDSSVRSLTALTDGRNLYGEILPIPAWMAELARRHDLERERPLIVAARDARYAKQRVSLIRLGWLAFLLAVGILFTILVTRILRLRQVARIRERLAADLHDELGANLHTIGLLSDMASESGDSPEEMATLHRRIRSETERSGLAVRHCTDMLSGKMLDSDFEEEMKRSSRRIMSKLKHTISIEGEEFLKALKPRMRYDLFLFYKECLVNISRHADASEYATFLKLDGREVELVISDNGKGIDSSSQEGIPSSLKRRARLLGGRLSVDSSPQKGTRIALSFNSKKKRLLPTLNF